MTMTAFISLPEVQEMPGEYAKCGDCNTVVLRAEMQAHKCPPSPEQKQEGVEVTDLVTAYEAVSMAPGLITMKDAIHRLERIRKIVCDYRYGRLEKRLTPSVLYKLVSQELDHQIARVREMREEEYELNDVRRSQGVPFAERSRMLNKSKLAWCDQEEARLILLRQSFAVRPLRQWFDAEVDYDAAKKMGLGWIIKIKLDQIIYGEKNTGDRRR